MYVTDARSLACDGGRIEATHSIGTTRDGSGCCSPGRPNRRTNGLGSPSTESVGLSRAIWYEPVAKDSPVQSVTILTDRLDFESKICGGKSIRAISDSGVSSACRRADARGFSVPRVVLVKCVRKLEPLCKVARNTGPTGTADIADSIEPATRNTAANRNCWSRTTPGVPRSLPSKSRGSLERRASLLRKQPVPDQRIGGRTRSGKLQCIETPSSGEMNAVRKASGSIVSTGPITE